jgi:7-carboxy-7-deazaguanine synthase
MEMTKLQASIPEPDQDPEPIVPAPEDPPANTLPIVETFHSLQGEGYWAGTDAFFIRIGGCTVGCPWCDTKLSWNPKLHPQRSIGDLAAEARAAQPRLVIITGGEPSQWDLTSLTIALKEANLRPHVETSGAYPLRGQFDWVTLSPKPFKPPHPTVYPQVQELKVIIAQAQDFDWAEEQSAQVGAEVWRYLQPEWNQPQAAQWIMDYIRSHPQWRLSLQTHKILSIR